MKNRRRTLLCFIALVVLTITLSGCTTRRFVKPRSTIIEEAEDQGIEVTSVEEDRKRFYEYETKSRERIVNLIDSRLKGEDTDPQYRIGASDEIEIRVFDVPELNTTVRVSQSGYVDLPLIGPVEAVGLTQSSFENSLRGKLAKYVRDPQVNTFISVYGSQLISVLGAVKVPDRYPLKKGENSLLELLGTAGGITDRSANYLNFIPAERSGLDQNINPAERARYALNVRADSRNAEDAIEIYLDDIYGTKGGIPLEIPVRSGDMIIVPEAGRVLVEGEVQKPGSFELGKRTTLLGALAASGGITYGAKIDEVELIRPARNGGQLRLVVDLEKILNGTDDDYPVRNADIIRVPSDSGRRMAQDTFEGISRIVNVGVGGTVDIAN